MKWGAQKEQGATFLWGSAVFVLGRVRASGWGWRMPLTWAGCSVAPEKLLLPERSDSAQLILLATCGAPTKSGAGARAPSHPRTRELRASGCIRCTHAALHPIPSKETRIDCIQQWLLPQRQSISIFFHKLVQYYDRNFFCLLEKTLAYLEKEMNCISYTSYFDLNVKLLTIGCSRWVHEQPSAEFPMHIVLQVLFICSV